MKKSTILISVLCLLGTPAAYAAFQAVSDFQNGTLTGFLEEHDPALTAGGSGGISVVTDPFVTSTTNKVLKLNPGTFAVLDPNNVWFTVPIPAITAKGTIYYRVAVTDDTNDVVAGACLIDPQAWGDFSAVWRHQNTGVYDYYDNTSYSEPSVDSSYPAKHWLQVWQVVDAAANTYDVWVKGDTKWTTQTKIVSGATFRKKGNTAIAYFASRISTDSVANPSSLNPAYYDDIYVDTTGQNLAIPGAVVTGNNGQLIAVSTRGYVGTGDSNMIVGFTISGDSRKVLIRGVGPTLSTFGVSGVLADPQISLYSSSNTTTALATNDNWGTATNATDITAAITATGLFALPANSLDSAILTTLAPGSYTVVASGKNSGTGVAIIEVYQVN